MLILVAALHGGTNHDGRSCPSRTPPDMSSDVPPLRCRFLHEMVGLLAATMPLSPARREQEVFRRLIELEMQAEAGGASETSCRVIASVRRMAGNAIIRADLPVIRE